MEHTEYGFLGPASRMWATRGMDEEIGNGDALRQFHRVGIEDYHLTETCT